MKIAPEYDGNWHIAIIHNGIRHLFIDRGDSDFLTKEIQSYKVAGKELRVLGIYGGVNEDAYALISDATERLNNGEQVDLEGLLEKAGK